MPSIEDESILKRKRNEDTAVGDGKSAKRRRGGGPDDRKKHKGRSEPNGDVKNQVQENVPGDESTPQKSKAQSWVMTDPIGGRFIDSDPLFCDDEKLLIFATESSVHAYSTSTSLRVRSFPSNAKDSICDYTVDYVNPNVLWVATIKGRILKMDLMSGSRLGSHKTQGLISQIETATRPRADMDEIFTIESDGKTWVIKIRQFQGFGSGASISDSVTLLQRDSAICGMRVLDGGKIIVAINLTGILVCIIKPSASGVLNDLDYTWREIKCSEPPVCFDVKLKSRGPQEEPSKIKEQKQSQQKQEKQFKEKKKQKQQQKQKQKDDAVVNATFEILDVAVGGAKGCILVYEDLLRRLDELERPLGSNPHSRPLAARELHWHRESVGAVAWSLDGNYLISGGNETTMVVWQLDTGHKQFLPNLESPVQNIVVSPGGSSYAVRLGDNSLMILSTSELTPSMYVAGIQSLSFSKIAKPRPLVPTYEDAIQLANGPQVNHAAAVMDPHTPGRLLVAVPASQPANFSLSQHHPSPYVQSFDILTSRHHYRQAISRTNAIASNLAPEGNRIQEPDVQHLQISHDGQWLATVDEWMPSNIDIQELFVKDELRKGLKETYGESRLRIWQWNADENVWFLNSRIDDPHGGSDNKVGSGRVLNMCVDPWRNSFATVGNDSIVRIWKPRSKLDNGRVVRREVRSNENSKTSARTTWWVQEHAISLPSITASAPLHLSQPTRAIMAYSNDSTVLAVYQTCTGEDIEPEDSVYFIDATRGTLHETRAGLHTDVDGIHSMGFLSRYLIFVGGEMATVWDVTSFELQFSVPLMKDALKTWSNYRWNIGINSPDRPNITNTPVPLLAVDLATSTFAISIPQFVKDPPFSGPAHPILRFKSRVAIFSPGVGAQPLTETTLPRATFALMPAGGTVSAESHDEDLSDRRRGYVALDVGGEARILKPGKSYRQRGPKINMPNAESTGGIKGDQAPHVNGLNTNPNHEEQAAATGSDEEVEAEAGEEDLGSRRSALDAAASKHEDSRPVVRSEQLAEVFDHPSHAMPPMRDLFQSVLELYAEKPTAPSEEVEDSEDEQGGNEAKEEDLATNDTTDSSSDSSGDSSDED